MTRRERLERKAEKRREWAAGRADKAEALYKIGEHFRHDWAFITQPGHIPERARMNRRDEQAHEHSKMAAHHIGKAAGLEAQLERSTFSDDPDAIEQLRAKIADAEAKQEQHKAINRIVNSKPKHQPTPGKLAALMALGMSEALAAECFKPDFCGRVGIPSYVLQNNNANIRRMRERIKDIERRQQAQEAAEANGGLTVKRHEPHNWCVVTFSEKPAREILNALREADYRWSGGAWHGRLDKLPQCVSELEARCD